VNKTVKIGEKLVGQGHPPYIIAEACINHQGDLKTAEKMVYMAHAMGSDAIKFQMHVLDDEMLREAPISKNFDESLYDTLDKTNLSLEEHKKIQSLCNRLGIMYLCTPFSKASADLVDSLDVPVFKVGSGELTNIPLQKYIAGKGRPMIVSTGMSELHEIDETVAAIMKIGAPIILTHCVSAYPCPYERVNLGNIPKYQKMYDVPIGLSDHSQGIYTSLGAVALGACLIEKHFTLDKAMPGPDHSSSIEPFELGELVRGANAVFLASGSLREIFPEEKEIVAWARESVVSVVDIAAGVEITAEMVSVKRPSPGEGAVAAKHLEDVIGKKAVSNIAVNKQVLWKQIG
jgi:N,N'-diacetyllegionaminate synthase